jgi:hypothetical protein
MITRGRQGLILLVTLLMAGCAQYQLVNVGEQIAMGDAFTINPQRVWSRIDHGRIELWTVDGPLLDQVLVYKGIEDGQNLLIPNPAAARKVEDFPTFQKAMTPLEVRDLLEATFARAQQVDVKTFDMEPWKFADTDGFRFDYAFTTKSGLRKRGFTVGAIHNERLFMIVFSAAELYYFDKYAVELEKLVSSIERKA